MLTAILMAMPRGFLKAILEAILNAILESILNAILKAKRSVLKAHIIIGFGETKGKGKNKPSDSFFVPFPPAAHTARTHQKGTLL